MVTSEKTLQTQSPQTRKSLQEYQKLIMVKSIKSPMTQRLIMVKLRKSPMTQRMIMVKNAKVYRHMFHRLKVYRNIRDWLWSNSESLQSSVQGKGFRIYDGGEFIKALLQVSHDSEIDYGQIAKVSHDSEIDYGQILRSTVKCQGKQNWLWWSRILSAGLSCKSPPLKIIPVGVRNCLW